jgi:hypothetical protein
MSMTEAERAEAAALIRQDLEEEHRQRLAGVVASQERANDRRHDKNSQRRREEMDGLRLQLQEKFYEDNGYQIYVDSRGNEMWLSPEEHAWRTSRRGARRADKGKHYVPVGNLPPKIILFYIAGAALAVGIGLMLVN